MSIQFKPTDPKFAEFFYRHRQDPENKLYNPLLPSTIEELRERLSNASSDWSKFESTDGFFWFLELDSQLIGIASIQNINKMMLTAEIGYGIEPEFRGKGFATKSIRALTANTFTNTPLRKLIAYVHEENHASRKALEKAGYRQEGLLHEHYLINGVPCNEAIYGILNPATQTLNSSKLNEKL